MKKIINMGSASRVLLLCDQKPTLISLLPSFTQTPLRQRLNSLFTTRRSSNKPYLMSTSGSHSPSSITSSDNNKPSDSQQQSTPSASSAIDFLTLCHRLKSTKRTGWIKRNVKDPESISDHMYRMGIMALISSDIPGVDRDKCIKMALVHDIAEAIVGDIAPSDGVPKEEKSRREREALDHMCKLLGGGSRAQEIHELWLEYEENLSPEAKVVKDFDKVEMILQALEYETEQGKDLDEFFQSTAGKFQTEVGKAWAYEIVARRSKEQ